MNLPLVPSSAAGASPVIPPWAEVGERRLAHIGRVTALLDAWARALRLDPDEAQEISVEEYLLQRAVVSRARSEQQLLDAVAQARAKGLSWQKIGELIGTSAQAAQQRYGAALESI